ncbi:MAG: phosphopentomutase [Gemmatimonadaceae bacterium]|nr:phosphopentomutase [Gemmatimonadaceae bacterium]NUQ94612.1 phosphopentomutase [Gemmatimonadaceae bacterium]NUR18679.1 phosphopentomutase [Gemmatimonadaceae bacterium]NUS98022.1 phosphopentomutase [Gemmatimonadaceae bacterium]
MIRRALILVLDGVGIGEAPDAARYGDVGSDTLGNLARAVGGLDLPNLEAAGLGRIKPIAGVKAVDEPRGAFGLMIPRSAGKDSTTGHWEIAGVHLASPFPTYPNGFPADVVAAFERIAGRKVIGNVVGSGTAIIDEYGAEQMRTGGLILYTSADSVFQVAAHEEIVPLEELYAACEGAREMLVAPNDVSRVIARPFTGEPGAFKRTANRRDFSIAPPAETLLDTLAAAGVPRTGVGKTDDLFAGRNLRSRHTASNAEGIAAILEWLRSDQVGFCFANLVDFDQLFGHRNDTAGFYGALRELDRALPTLTDALREDDLLFITADHGNDPTTPSTDHARECVPLLVLGAQVHPVALGARDTFSDLGATVAEYLGVPYHGLGTSFERAILRG